MERVNSSTQMAIKKQQSGKKDKGTDFQGTKIIIYNQIYLDFRLYFLKTKIQQEVIIQVFNNSRYTSESDKTEEEIMFWEGTADGPAKLTNLEDGKFRIQFLRDVKNISMKKYEP